MRTMNGRVDEGITDSYAGGVMLEGLLLRPLPLSQKHSPIGSLPYHETLGQRHHFSPSCYGEVLVLASSSLGLTEEVEQPASCAVPPRYRQINSASIRVL